MKFWPDDKRDLFLIGVLLCALFGFNLMIGGQGVSTEHQWTILRRLGITDLVMIACLLTAWAVTRPRKK